MTPSRKSIDELDFQSIHRTLAFRLTHLATIEPEKADTNIQIYKTSKLKYIKKYLQFSFKIFRQNTKSVHCIAQIPQFRMQIVHGLYLQTQLIHKRNKQLKNHIHIHDGSYLIHINMKLIDILPIRCQRCIY